MRCCCTDICAIRGVVRIVSYGWRLWVRLWPWSSRIDLRRHLSFVSRTNARARIIASLIAARTVCLIRVKGPTYESHTTAVHHDLGRKLAVCVRLYINTSWLTSIACDPSCFARRWHGIIHRHHDTNPLSRVSNFLLGDRVSQVLFTLFVRFRATRRLDLSSALSAPKPCAAV